VIDSRKTDIFISKPLLEGNFLTTKYHKKINSGSDRMCIFAEILIH